jgi:hypothetical protein
MRSDFEKNEAREYRSGLAQLASSLKEIRALYIDCLRFVNEKKDKTYQEVAAKDLVELYSYLVIGYLLLDEAEENDRKVFIANRYILSSLASARRNAESIKSGVFTDLLHADSILQV